MIGIIGGTILLERQALIGVQADTVETGHGPAEIERGTLAGVPVALIQRHGRRRDRPPHRVNHGANLTALAALGVRQVLALGSTGALRVGLTVPALMVPHDYINFFDTTVFHDRLVHVTPGFDEPLRALLIEEARRTAGEGADALPVYDRGVYFQVRGPRLDTPAEVALAGGFADCVGMTIASEATVARELGLAYAALCTLDNHANGLGPAGAGPVRQGDIQAAATSNANVCLAVLSAVLRRLSA
jgi:5'-methylthioadenosine phosphorylase